MPRAKAAPSSERQLEIKTKVVKRLAKEVAHYEEETKEHEARIEAMRSSNKDPYDVKKAVEVLDETKLMIPDAQRRLRDALDDLENLVDSVQDVDVSAAKTYLHATRTTLCQQ
mmetsp:Transcript_33700/g.107700  ORF Transcript_33700/g.107700 Transcript_33700/m.107700 type:complete len:113 (+) Transcript_33700:1812-2150(+)